MVINRRQALWRGLSGLAGVGAAWSGIRSREAYLRRYPLPFYGGYASMLPPDPTHRMAGESRLVWGADLRTKDLALTFDDGPSPTWTPQVLAALERQDVAATFFCRGDNVLAHGSLHRDSQRHELANHSWDHPDLARMNFDEVRDQLVRTDEVMEATYGRRPTLFRPPYGHVGGSALIAAASLGLTTVAWSAQFRESRFHDDPDGIVADIMSLVHPGAIVLGHDTGPRERLIALDRLDEIIGRLKDDGWRFHTVSGLLALQEDEKPAPVRR